MYRVAIVDDDRETLAALRAYLSRYQDERDARIQVEEFVDGSDLVSGFAPRYDVIFLDVDMANLDGLATARLIREVDPHVVLVFITNLGQYAIRGYEVGALSYLVKPVPYFAFAQELKRSLEWVERRSDDAVLLRVDRDLLRVRVAEIIYVESIKHRLAVHRFEDQLSLVGTLKDMAELLVPHGFFRINSYLLVNLNHVRAVHSGVVTMADGTELPVSRSRRKPFLEALVAHFGGAIP